MQSDDEVMCPVCLQENSVILKELVKLRARKSSLLGFTTHADFVLEMNMAKSGKKVAGFLGESCRSNDVYKLSIAAGAGTKHCPLYIINDVTNTPDRLSGHSAPVRGHSAAISCCGNMMIYSR